MTAVEVRCERCGEANAPGARFCSSCGTPLGAAVAAQEERKLVSVLFVDLVGSTARADKADPEDVRDVLQRYHREAKACIEEYGGVVEKFIGDAVMAVFGAPVAHGDDAERAVRAGLRVLERIDELNANEGLELAARAAVNTGEAIVSVRMRNPLPLTAECAIAIVRMAPMKADHGRISPARVSVCMRSGS